MNNERKKVSILGSTGSVGTNTLDLLKRSPKSFKVSALTANTNVNSLVEQAKATNAEFVAIADPKKYIELKKALSGTKIEVAAGPNSIIEAALRDCDFLMASIVGVAGLVPTMEAVKSGKIIGLANKECLVSAGNVFVDAVKLNRATIIPVDSEHSAIFQVFDTNQTKTVRRVILTASGGPFRKFNLKELHNVTCEQALNHPNWDMGAKISIDSATMMNKGLELIEAFYLFPVNQDAIEILIHPESIIHSMVDYIDGSVLAQLAPPDMRIPIAYALGWPKRIKTPVKQLKLEEIGRLSFMAPDQDKFPSLRLAREALKQGGNAPTILNAANEIAVSSFLTGKINFLTITNIVEETLKQINSISLTTIDDVVQTDLEARRVAKNLCLSES